ncbi:MAG: hypothetical protein GY809_02490, partial [Planctomycetes bacterium]|nr:hypothetical protein [Planctomycetota bacterium]
TNFRCRVRGLHTASLAGYLSPLGVSAASENIEAGFRGELVLTTSTPPPEDATDVSPAGQPRLDARVALSQAFVKADNRDVLGLNELTMTANIPDQQTVNITDIQCAQGDMHVWLREQDKLELAGLRFQKPSEITPKRASSAPRTAPLEWSLNQLNIRALSLHIHDTLAAPATESTVTLDRFTVGDLRGDTTGHYTQAHIEAQLSAPGVFRTAQLKGKADLISLEKSLDATFLIEGLAPTGLHAYLNRMGLESLHKDAQFSGHVRADMVGPNPDSSFRLNANITDLLVNDPNELFSLDRIVIDALEINPLTQRLHINAIDVSGQHFPVQRNQDKSYSILGFKIHPTASQTSIPGASAGPNAVAPNHPLPAVPNPGSVTIKRFSWQNSQIELIDQVSPGHQATMIPISYGLDVNNVQWDASDPNTLQPAAQVHFWCKAPDVADSLRLDGTITP